MRAHHLPAALVAVLVLTGCAQGTTTRPGTVRVEAAFYPLAFLVERIGGDAVTVDDLTRAGGEPHDLELKASQVGDIRDATIIVYLKGFQPALDKVVPASSGLDLTTVVPFEHADQALSNEHGATLDPHVWLDPVRMATMAAAVTDRLAAAVPGQANTIRARGAALTDALRGLDADYRQRLGSCARHDVVTSHAAFAYLGRRYGLSQLGIAGLSPDEEPTAKRLAEVGRFVRQHHVTTIFFETLVSPKLAQTVARSTGARTAVLDPIEGVASGSGKDYLSIMRDNLTALVAALGCA